MAAKAQAEFAAIRAYHAVIVAPGLLVFAGNSPKSAA
jgi:hypothetical protein